MGTMSDLDPAAIRTELVRAGLLLVAFETLRGQLEHNLRGFFADDFRNLESLPSDEYRREVLARHKSSFLASALWYIDQGVLAADDIPALERIRLHRNEVAHELPNYLFDATRRIDVGLLEVAQRYIDTIGNHWARTWASCDPAFDDVDLQTANIEPAASLLMKYLLDSVHEMDREQNDGQKADADGRPLRGRR